MTKTVEVTEDQRVMLLHAAVVFERDCLLATLEARTSAVRALVEANPQADITDALERHAEAVGAWARFLVAHPETLGGGRDGDGA